MSDAIKNLRELFAKFPTVGKRTAGRFVSYLVSLPKEEINILAKSIQAIKENVSLCAFCFNPHENNQTSSLCLVCQAKERDNGLLCIVEKEADLNSIEATKQYKGLYFILHDGSSRKSMFLDSLRIQALKERVQNPKTFGLLKDFTEIIIATNETPEGKTASTLVQRSLKELPQFINLKITHLAKGLPVGGELEYADQETIESAFSGRK